jgi:hypothetical protein
MSSIVQKQIGLSSGIINLVTTAETLVAYTGRCEANLPTLRAIIRGWALITPGTGTTAMQLRIRRGNGITGAVVGVTGPISLAMGQYFDTDVINVESVSNVEYVDYSLTVQATGASANGTVGAATIEVELING